MDLLVGFVILLILIIAWIFGIFCQFLTKNDTIGGREPEKQECDIIVPFERIITPDTRKLPYRRRQEEYKFTLHIGQRKLLLSEIEFLTKIGSEGKCIVYAGSANGTHIMLLAGELFPHFEYYLYDPAPFDPGLQNYKNVHIFNQYFTDETCKEWAGRDDVLFISDIRRTPEESFYTSQTGGETFEKMIKEDMQWQMDWVNIIKPQWSMLKFRLPYSAGKTKYLDGDLYFQVWAGETSSETRLWVKKGAGTKMYDNTEYENICYRHNLCTRMQYFSLDPITREEIEQFKGLEFDYDSRAEIHILSEYLKSPSVETLLDLYRRINKVVRSPLADTHGRLPLMPMSREKMEKLKKLYPMEKKMSDQEKKRTFLKKRTISKIEN